MLKRKSRLDQEVPTWLAGLDAALVPKMLPAGDGYAKCNVNAASPSVVVIVHARVSAGVEVAAETTGRGGA